MNFSVKPVLVKITNIEAFKYKKITVLHYYNVFNINNK